MVANFFWGGEGTGAQVSLKKAACERGRGGRVLSKNEKHEQGGGWQREIMCGCNVASMASLCVSVSPSLCVRVCVSVRLSVVQAYAFSYTKKAKKMCHAKQREEVKPPPPHAREVTVAAARST